MAITDLSQTIIEISKQVSLLNGEHGLIALLAAFVGAFFVFQGVWRLAKGAMSNGYGGNDKNPWSPILFGILLLNFWQAQTQLSDQLALTGNMLAPSIPNGYMTQVWAAIKVILNGYGAIAIFRGMLLAKAAGEGTASGHQSPAWGSLWHIVGGAILMKI
jgi:hypothetical protein